MSNKVAQKSAKPRSKTSIWEPKDQKDAPSLSKGFRVITISQSWRLSRGASSSARDLGALRAMLAFCIAARVRLLNCTHAQHASTGMPRTRAKAENEGTGSRV